MAMVIAPLPLVAGLIGAPVLGNAIGRTFITPKEAIASQPEADAELRRLIRSFAIFDAVLALGLGYAAARAPLDTAWRSAALGGAIGAGLLSASLTAALVLGPERAEAPPPMLPAGPAAIRPGWYSNIIGARAR